MLSIPPIVFATIPIVAVESAKSIVEDLKPVELFERCSLQPPAIITTATTPVVILLIEPCITIEVPPVIVLEAS